MFRRKVTARDGRTWTLGRRWMPARTRLGRAPIPEVGGGGWSDLPLEDFGILGAIVIAVLAVIAAVFIALILFNVIAIALEVLIVVVLLVAGVVGRVVFRRPWTVFARSGSEIHTAAVAGWRASGRAIRDTADALESGRLESPAGNRR